MSPAASMRAEALKEESNEDCCFSAAAMVSLFGALLAEKQPMSGSSMYGPVGPTLIGMWAGGDPAYAYVTANVFTDIPCARQKLKPQKNR